MMEQIRDRVIQAATGESRRERIAAFGVLVDRFKDMAVGYSYSLLGDFHLAEDAAQDAFVTAFDKLDQLTTPDAFPGWFRKIVWSACRRIQRRETHPTTNVEAADCVADAQANPADTVERREIKGEVLAAIGQLPDNEREVTTLFYINGYSQSDIADFLEVPVTTVKHRLKASKRRIKERMLDMVKDALHDNAPADRFDKRIIEELLSQPCLLAVADHPLRQLYESFVSALPEFTIIDGDEIVNRQSIANPWTLQFAVPTDEQKILRTETTVTTFSAMVGQTPPVRLMTAGRAFRNDEEDSTKRNVFHQFDLVCIEAGAGEAKMKADLQKIYEAILGTSELRYEQTTLPSLDPCYRIQAYYQNAWRGVGGCGVFKPEFLEASGFDSAAVQGYVYATELENLAMVKFGISDVSELWQPPYLS